MEEFPVSGEVSTLYNTYEALKYTYSGINWQISAKKEVLELRRCCFPRPTRYFISLSQLPFYLK